MVHPARKRDAAITTKSAGLAACGHAYESQERTYVGAIQYNFNQEGLFFQKYLAIFFWEYFSEIF